MLDEITAVTEGEKLLRLFTYHMDIQIASATRADGRRESDLWDGAVRRPAAVAGTLRGPVPQSPGGLMIHRNGTEFTNEPAVTGGNPVLAGGKVLFNDLLGNTLGAKDENAYRPVTMTAFGETDNADAFFTGKPLIGDLGYAFLFRNYRAEQGKWQTADPLGNPDGWNNLAYVNNVVTMAIDWMDGLEVYVWNYRGSKEAWEHASLKLNNLTYISWWLQGENRESIPLVNDVYTADAIKNRTYQDDMDGEGGRAPDTKISIEGLDEKAIEEWWNNFKDDPENKWQTLSQNCSTTVADALKAGNASTPWWDFWNSWNIVWIPEDISNFANAIDRKLK